MKEFQNEVFTFTNRIKKAFSLTPDTDGLIGAYRELSDLVYKEDLQIYRINKEKPKNQSFLSSINPFKSSNNNDYQLKREAACKSLAQYIQEKKIPQQYVIQQDVLPARMKNLVNMLKGRQIPAFYGYLKGPFITGYYIKRKEDFSRCVQSCDFSHKLKFVMINSGQVHQYQRNIIQQIFGRIFRDSGCLSGVYKIEMDNKRNHQPISQFCYIEDIKQDMMNLTLESIIVVPPAFNMVIKSQGIDRIIDEQNIMLTFLAEILIVPVQTLVSEFMVRITDDKVELIKNYPSKVQNQRMYKKQHPSILNPLYYFQNFIRQHEFAFTRGKAFLDKRTLYANFYSAINIIVELILNDYSFDLQNVPTNSFCFDMYTFSILWKTFHQLVMLSEWIEEVIYPLKKRVSLYEILQRFSPIFNEVNKIKRTSYKEYKEYILNQFDVSSFLTTCTDKQHLQLYRDMCTTLSTKTTKAVYLSRQDIYNCIFKETVDQMLIHNNDIIEVAYFLNFMGRNITPTANQTKTYCHLNIWRKVYKLLQKGQITGLDLQLDIFGFQIGVDTVQLSRQPFSNAKNQTQSAHFFERLTHFVKFLKNKYPQKYSKYLSMLLEQAFKYRKYKICQHLLNNKIFVKNYEELFEYDEILSQAERNCKEKVLILMKEQAPQSHRCYLWEELLRKTMKVATSQARKVHSLHYEQCWVSSKVYDQYFCGQITNNLSRKDYLYHAERQVAKFKISQKAENTQLTELYIQFVQHPLLRYFYKYMHQQLNADKMLLNFACLFGKYGQILQIGQCIPQSFNLMKGLQTYGQNQIKNFTFLNCLSECIIISMMIMPSKVSLHNLILSPSIKNCYFLLVDYCNFYQKEPIIRKGNTFHLKSKNILFAFDEMNKLIPKEMMIKYSQIDVMSIITTLFRKLSTLIAKFVKVSEKTEKAKQILSGNQQFYQFSGLIFQEKFILKLAERMFIIKRTLSNKLKTNSTLSHMQLLAQISPQLSCFYTEIIFSAQKLIERQHILMDDFWQKPLVKENNMINFFSSSLKIPEQTRNFPQHYRMFKFEGPTENLSCFYHHALQFTVFQDKSIDILTASNKTASYYINHANFSGTNKQEREKYLESIQARSALYKNSPGKTLLQSILLNHIQLQKERKYAFSFECVKQFTLTQSKVASSQLEKIVNEMTQITYIRLHQLKAFKNFGSNYYLGNSFQLNHLRSLIITECDELQLIDFKCNLLENCCFRKNKLLKTLYVNSSGLINLDCSMCPKLKLQNIAIYVFKGVNVLLGDDSCDGQLRDIAHSNYSCHLFAILKYLLQANDNQTRDVILTTLLKTSLFDGYLTAAGINSLGQNLSSILLKVSDTQSKMIEKVIQLILSNKQVNELNIKSLYEVKPKFIQIIKSLKDRIPHTYTKFTLSTLQKANAEQIDILQSLLASFPFDKNLVLVIEGLNYQSNTSGQQKSKKIGTEIESPIQIKMKQAQEMLEKKKKQLTQNMKDFTKDLKHKFNEKTKNRLNKQKEQQKQNKSIPALRKEQKLQTIEKKDENVAVKEKSKQQRIEEKEKGQDDKIIDRGEQKILRAVLKAQKCPEDAHNTRKMELVLKGCLLQNQLISTLFGNEQAESIFSLEVSNSTLSAQWKRKQPLTQLKELSMKESKIVCLSLFTNTTHLQFLCLHQCELGQNIKYLHNY